MFKSIILLFGCLVSLALCQYTGNYTAVPMPSGVNMGIMDSGFYDQATRNLYFCNLLAQDVIRYSEPEGQMYAAKVPDQYALGAVIPTTTEDVFYIAANDADMNWLIAGHGDSILTGTVGKTFCGGDVSQGFFGFSSAEGVTTFPGLYKTSNAILYDEDNHVVYKNDGCTQELKAFQLDQYGQITDSWTVISSFGFPENSGATTGKILKTAYEIGDMYELDPSDGTYTKIATLPTKLVSSPVYGGGESMRRMYVPTASFSADLTTAQPDGTPAQYPAGYLLIFDDQFGEGKPVKKPVYVAN